MKLLYRASRHIYTLFSVLLSSLVYPIAVFAQPPPPPPPPPGGIVPPPGGLPGVGGAGAVPGWKPTGPTIPIPSTSISTIGDFYQAACAVTQWIMVFGLIIGVAFIIYGGVRYVTSGGDESKAGDAKKTILTALIGVVFLVLAVALVRIIASFFGATNFSLDLSTVTCTAA